MAHDKLDNLVKIGELKVENTTEEEVTGLIRSGLARLADSKNKDLNIESQFDLAYNAAHALSLAALRAHGYRSESRYLVFQSSSPTVDRYVQIAGCVIGFATPAAPSSLERQSRHPRHEIEFARPGVALHHRVQAGARG